MAGDISVFGYSVPLTVVFVFLALVIGLALIVLFWLTVGWSVYRSTKATRREAVRDELQNELLERMFNSETDWSQWVEGMSGVEREVVETLLDDYLRELDGQHNENLRGLGEALGIPDRSQRWLESGGEYKRLYALTWLAFLHRPDRLHATEFRPRTPRERAAVARMRYESDDLDDATEGMALLVDDNTSQLSAFGQDTLYRITIDEPAALFEVAADDYQAWSDSLLVQVLIVCQSIGGNVMTEDLSWLTATLEHENEAVRKAAALALGNIGWRSDVRDALFLDRLLDDPSSRVRGAVYRMLARWGDEEALETLASALQTEQNPRARLAGTDALARQQDHLPGERTEPLDRAWQWSHEHVEYDRVARRRGNSVSG